MEIGDGWKGGNSREEGMGRGWDCRMERLFMHSIHCLLMSHLCLFSSDRQITERKEFHSFFVRVTRIRTVID